MAVIEKAFRGMGRCYSCVEMRLPWTDVNASYMSHVAWLFSDTNSNTYTIVLEEMGVQKEAHIVRW